MDKVLGPLEAYPSSLAISPDELVIMYTTNVKQGGADLMLIENFR